MKLFKQIIATTLVLASMGSEALANNNDLSGIHDAKHREMTNKRDQYRHPVETLAFFQVEANHNVIEIWPGGSAWYTEVLAPYLRDSGSLLAAHYNPNSEKSGRVKALAKFQTKLAANPEIYDKITMGVFNPPNEFQLGDDNSADRVLTFRNLHNWMGYGEEGVLAIFKAFYKVLKPGGKLGVVDHRLFENMGNSRGGYVSQAYAIKMAELAGFKLEASSEINANAKDTKDYEQGVWTLPPVLTLKDKDRAKYVAIGESDRMTLLFVKE